MEDKKVNLFIKEQIDQNTKRYMDDSEKDRGREREELSRDPHQNSSNVQKQQEYEGELLQARVAQFDCTKATDEMIISSTRGLFPLPNTLLTDNILSTVRQQITSEEEKMAHEKARQIVAYFTSPNKEGIDVQNLSLLQSIIIVNDLIASLPLTGLAHFAAINRILIQCDGIDHILKYGKNSYVMPMTPVFLDHNHGITGAGPITEVRRQLDYFYRRWKSSGFSGSLIYVNDVDFSSLFRSAIELKNINSFELLIQFQIDQCKNKYLLTDNNTFIECITDLYHALKLDTKQHDFFEYCVFSACGVLPLVKDLTDGLNLRFYHTVSEVKHNITYDMAPVYFGIADNDYFASHPEKYYYNNSQFKVNQESDHYLKLTQFASALEKGCQEKLDHSAIVHDCAIQMNNLQRCLFIHRQVALKAFLANPLLKAKFIIDHASEIEDKRFVMDACVKLPEELNEFRHLHNGPSDELIDHLITKLNELSAGYTFLNKASNKALYGDSPCGSNYTIDLSNDNYINAITTYNKESWIIEIDDRPCHPEISITQLPELIAKKKISSNTMKILVATKESSVMNSIIPSFPTEEIKKSIKEQIDEVGYNVYKVDQAKVKQVVTSINRFLTNRFISNDDKASVYCEPLNEDEVFRLLDQLNNTRKLYGAIWLPGIDTILFKIAEFDECYAFHFGKQYCKISVLSPFDFDIDDGFYVRPVYKKYYESYQAANQVIGELQKQFEKWKAQDYQGPMFDRGLLPIAGKKTLQFYYDEDYCMLIQISSYNRAHSPKGNPYSDSAAAAYHAAETRMKQRQQEYEFRKREEERRQLEENRYNGKSITEIANEIRALSTNEFHERYNAFNEINPRRGFVEILLMGAFDKPDARRKHEDILINRIADKMGLPRLELVTSASVSQATSPFVLFNLKTQQIEQSSSEVNVQQENGVTQLPRNFDK